MEIPIGLTVLEDECNSSVRSWGLGAQSSLPGEAEEKLGRDQDQETRSVDGDESEEAPSYLVQPAVVAAAALARGAAFPAEVRVLVAGLAGLQRLGVLGGWDQHSHLRPQAAQGSANLLEKGACRWDTPEGLEAARWSMPAVAPRQRLSAGNLFLKSARQAGDRWWLPLLLREP